MKAALFRSGVSLISFSSGRPRKRLLILALYAIAAMLTARANNLIVTSTADSGANTLRAQVAAANAGDTITFQSSLSGAIITLTGGQILISSNLTIDASSLAVPINISGTSTSRIFQVSSSRMLTLNSLVLQNGTQTNDVGGAIRVDGGLVASNCTFKFNTARGGAGVDPSTPANLQAGGAGGGGAGMGGAIFSDGISVTLAGCQFLNNSAQGGNGGNGGGGGPGGSPGSGGGPNGAGAGSSGNTGGFGGGGSGGALVGGYPYRGGPGGFGAGGGGAAALFQLGYGYTASPGGPGGTYGGSGASSGNAASGGGGGGAGLGGAIFSLGSSLYLSNCTFSANNASAGGGGAGGGQGGGGYGGAIFAITPALTQTNNTFIANSTSTSDSNIHLFVQPGLSMTQVNGGLHFAWPVDPNNTWMQYYIQFRNINPASGWSFLGLPITNNGTVYGCDAPVGFGGANGYYRLFFSPQ